MRSLAVFLLGMIVGVVGMLFLPELTPRREQLNAELKKQIDVLETQVRELGNQVKNSNLPKLGDEGAQRASPSPAASGHQK
jgi:uncharacterized membrane-anchored protein YhcB (DUF1043 family)